MTINRLETFRGNAFTVSKKLNYDITGFNIRAELYDSAGLFVRKGSSGVTNGADAQILITNATLGSFEIYFENNDTDGFADLAWLEIQTEAVSGEKSTVALESVLIKDSRITWSDLP